MSKNISEKYTKGEIAYDKITRSLYIIIPALVFIISMSLMWKGSLPENIIKDISNAFITVSGIVPGLLLSFFSNVTSLPEDNFFIKNIKKQGYFELLYKMIFADIALWLITLIAAIIMLVCEEIMLAKLTISFFISGVALFIYAFVTLARITMLTNK